MGAELLLVYFVYGLSFFAMGLAALLETGRAVSTYAARSLGWLAAFGLLHGAHEWFEEYLLQAHALGASLSPWLDWLRLGLLAVSFACLFAYASLSLAHTAPTPKIRAWLVALPALLGVAVALAAAGTYRVGTVPWTSLLDAASRYALAMPAALLASIALWHDARAALSEARRPVAVNLLLATYGFGVYAITQVFVHRLLFLPAAALNQDAFLSFTGLPIQALRAAAAVLIAVGLLRAMQVMEEERQSQLAAAQQARLTALEQRDSLRRDLLRHVVRSQEDERARIARELHDDISQQLTALSLELAALRTRLKRADTTQAADRLQDLARRMSRGLYQLVHDLRPSHLDHLGLVPALEFLISEDFRPKGLEVSLETAGMPGALGGLLETALFRVAQESLNNVVRHANVSQARIELCCDGQHVIMRVCDQGCGFDAGQEFRPPRGWGLAGMRERVESLGGLLRVHSAPGAGTVVEAVIPLRDEQRKEAVDGTHHTSPRG